LNQGGAPSGNQNAKKGKAWADAIRRAVREKYEGEDYEAKLAQLARKLVDAADDGDMAALKEVGDRHDGKAHQSVDAEIGGIGGGPVRFIVER
jgi:hypothetical protein